MVTATKPHKLADVERSARADLEQLRTEQVQLVEDLRTALVAGDVERALEIQRRRAELPLRVVAADIAHRQASIAWWQSELAALEGPARDVAHEAELARTSFTAIADSVPWSERDRARQLLDDAERQARVANAPVSDLRVRIKTADRALDEFINERARGLL
jgi:hypothetical protein